MPIAKGQPWGSPGPVPAGAVTVGSDAEASAVLESARRAGGPFPALVLTGGDLFRTLGGSAGPGTTAGNLFPIGVGEALLDGRLHLFVAHLVARSRLWRRAFVAMNAQFLGDWNLGPRAHPNDGRLDTYDARLPLGELPAVRSRVRSGTHLPHPGIVERRAASVTVELDRPLPVFLDGVPVGRARSIAVRARPDTLVVRV